MQYKNIPKIKVLRMPCQFNMIFSGIFENFLCKNYRGGICHLATRVEGAPYPPGRAPPTTWAHGGPPRLFPAPLFFLCLTQTPKTNSSTSSSPCCCDFRSPCSKLNLRVGGQPNQTWTEPTCWHFRNQAKLNPHNWHWHPAQTIPYDRFSKTKLNPF